MKISDSIKGGALLIFLAASMTYVAVDFGTRLNQANNKRIELDSMKVVNLKLSNELLRMKIQQESQ